MYPGRGKHITSDSCYGFPSQQPLFRRLIFSEVTVTLPDFTTSWSRFTFDNGHIVIGQFAPLFFHLPFKLFPVTAGFVFIHHLVLIIRLGIAGVIRPNALQFLLT